MVCEKEKGLGKREIFATNRCCFMKLYNKGLKTTFIVHLFSIPEDLFPLLTLIDWMMYLMAQKERKKERKRKRVGNKNARICLDKFHFPCT